MTTFFPAGQSPETCSHSCTYEILHHAGSIIQIKGASKRTLISVLAPAGLFPIARGSADLHCRYGTTTWCIVHRHCFHDDQHMVHCPQPLFSGPYKQTLHHGPIIGGSALVLDHARNKPLDSSHACIVGTLLLNHQLHPSAAPKIPYHHLLPESYASFPN